MQIIDTQPMKGHITFKLYNEQGQLKERRDINNLIVTVGKTFLASWLTTSQSTGFMQFVGLGTGNNAPTLADTTLQTELVGGGYSRAVGTLSSASNILQNTSTFLPGNGTGTLTEAGLFSALTSGTMFSRSTFSALSKGAGDTLVVNWQITLS